jgi:hypothetical protein
MEDRWRKQMNRSRVLRHLPWDPAIEQGGILCALDVQAD